MDILNLQLIIFKIKGSFITFGSANPPKNIDDIKEIIILAENSEENQL